MHSQYEVDKNHVCFSLHAALFRQLRVTTVSVCTQTQHLLSGHLHANRERPPHESSHCYVQVGTEQKLTVNAEEHVECRSKMLFFDCCQLEFF